MNTGLLILFMFIFLPNASYGADDGRGTLLLEGYIETQTKVGLTSNIGLELRDMKLALEKGLFEEAQDIYRNGKHYTTQDEETNDKMKYPLALLSKELDHDNLPTFLFHIYGLAHSDTKTNYKVNSNYADQRIEVILKDTTSGTLAAEAVMALSLWMKCSFYLWNTLANCRDVNFKTKNGFDKFIASWIGAGQTMEKGYALFDLSQQAEKMFGQSLNTPTNQIAKVNRDIVGFYNDIIKQVDFDGTCKSVKGRNAYEETYSLILRIQSKMMVPLVQMLISAMMENDIPRVKLYALAVIPQISQCKESKFLFLRDKLIFNQHYEKEEFRKIIAVLQSTFDCLGITCDEIGAYKDDKLPKCVDVPPPYPLAGYHPTTDVHQHGKIDLDIYQIKLLTEMGAWEQAKLIYTYGKNSFIDYENGNISNYRCLKAMAKTKSRILVKPLYEDFSIFYKDPNYADTVVTEALYGTGRYEQMPLVQRSETIVMTIQYQIMYMYSLVQLERSLAACNSQDPNRQKTMLQSWDESAAFLIGSLEGPKLGGSPKDGILLYHLANHMCKEFNTCTGNGWADVITLYQEYLYAGKGAMQGNDCEALAINAKSIARTILVPVYQCIIWYAVRNQHEETGSYSKTIAGGEVMTKSILPIVNSYPGPALDTLQRNMLMDKEITPVSDGPQAVANAIKETLDHLDTSCLMIGSFAGINACKLDAKASSSGVSYYSGYVVFSFVTFATGFLLFA